MQLSSNPVWAFRSVGDEAPILVVVVNATRHSVQAVGQPAVAEPDGISDSRLSFGSAIGNEATTEAYFGNGVDLAPAPGTRSGFVVQQQLTWPSVGGNVRAVHHFNIKASLGAGDSSPFINGVSRVDSIPTGPFDSYASEWAHGHLWGRADRGPLGAYPGLSGVSAQRAGFLKWVDRLAAIGGGIATFDFVVVEALVHMYGEFGVAGHVIFREGDVVFDGNGSDGLDDALAFIDANY